MARMWSERHIRELIARQSKDNGGGGEPIDISEKIILGKYYIMCGKTVKKACYYVPQSAAVPGIGHLVIDLSNGPMQPVFEEGTDSWNTGSQYGMTIEREINMPGMGRYSVLTTDVPKISTIDITRIPCDNIDNRIGWFRKKVDLSTTVKIVPAGLMRYDGKSMKSGGIFSVDGYSPNKEGMPFQVPSLYNVIASANAPNIGAVLVLRCQYGGQDDTLPDIDNIINRQ